MDQFDIVDWVSREIFPHEADVRAWLRRSSLQGAEADDIIQEAYCRLLTIKSAADIRQPRAYFFSVARSIVLEAFRRARVVRIDAVAEVEALDSIDPSAPAEQALSDRQELRRVEAGLAKLPPRCREIFVLRRIHGLSQREVAQRLKISENVVGKQTARALDLLLRALSDPAGSQGQNLVSTDDRRQFRN